MKEKHCFVATEKVAKPSAKYTSPHFLPASASVEMDYTLKDEVPEKSDFFLILSSFGSAQKSCLKQLSTKEASKTRFMMLSILLRKPTPSSFKRFLATSSCPEDLRSFLVLKKG